MYSVTFAMLGIVLSEIKRKSLSGCLNAGNGNQSTQIFFAKGNIWHSIAYPNKVEGEFALYQLLSWKRGSLSWSANVTAPLVSIDPQQAEGFFNTLLIMQQRGALLKEGNQILDGAFFGSQSKNDCAGLDTGFWQALIAANYCPYRDVSATGENFRQLIKTFETSKRTGVIKVEYNGFEEYHLIQAGISLGAYNYDLDQLCFKGMVQTKFSLFDLAGSIMCVFLMPPKNQIAASPVAKPTQSSQAQERLPDDTNPYDF
jgi:hypothetical protein